MAFNKYLSEAEQGGNNKLMTEAKEKKKQIMLEGDINALVLKMSIPTIIAQLITTIYNLTDTYFVSTLGTYAIAGVGVNHSLERTITMFGSLIGAGACSYIARLLGAKREEDANRVLSTSLFTGVAVGAMLAVFGTVFMVPLVNALGATDDCRPYAIQYATYVLCAAPFMVANLILNMCLRSEGSSKLAMIGIGAGGILNCILDPIFIYTFDLGVAGASMATAISKVVSFAILVLPYIRGKSHVQIGISHFRYVLSDIKEVLAIGSTSFFRAGLAVLSSVLINRVAGVFSTSTLAAMSLANRVMEFPFAIILGFGQGFQPVVGFNWGAKRKERVGGAMRFALTVSLIGGAAVGALLFIFASPIICVFNSEADAEVLRLGVMCMRFQSAVLFIHAWVSIVNMFYAGIGQAKCALLLSTARQGYCYLPMLWLLPLLFGVTGVTAVLAAADLLTLLPGIPLCIKAFRLIDDLPGREAPEGRLRRAV